MEVVGSPAVVAEGIETTKQANALQALGCRRAQGYLYARPLPADAISELLDRLPNIVPVKAQPTRPDPTLV